MSNLNFNFEISDNDEDIDTHKKSLSRSRSREKTSIDKPIQKHTHHSRGIYKKYTIEFKLKILSLSEKHSLKYIEREYGVKPSLVRSWGNNKEWLLSATHKNTSFKAIKTGGISSTHQYDGKIALYIKELRAMSMPVNTTDIILYAKELIKEFENRSIASLRNWAFRFIKRMGFCFRAITKSTTKLKDNISEYVQKFFIITRKIILDKNLLFNLGNIGNADETPIFMEMSDKKTISVIGDKEIRVKTFNKSHIRITVMLTILANGKSLIPFVVFKGKPKGYKEVLLKKHPKVAAGYLYVCCQDNSWVDEPAMRLYLREVWFKESIFKTTKNTLLIMDRARSHFSEEINDLFNKYDSNYVLIPPGLTSVLQPLDTHINKTFKYNVKNEYHKWLIKNKENTITDYNVLDFIYEAWYNTDQNIKEKVIFKSFKDNGITLKPDGSEDSEFLKIPKEFIELMKIENNGVDKNDINENIEEAVEEKDEAILPEYISNRYMTQVYKRNNNINSQFKDNSILDYFKKTEENDKMDLDDV